MPSSACELMSPNMRKGNVLIGVDSQPHAARSFAALMILTNAQWPPRGLLSGRWPPDDVERAGASASPGRHHRSASDGSRRSAEASHSDGAAVATAPRAAGRRERPKSARRPAYSHIIHCASIRQEARVVAMRELPHDLEEHGFEVQGVNLTAAAAAAAVLLEGGDAEDDEGAGPSGECEGALVEATFQFTTRAEWLVPGMRFVVRDQLGHVSGVGVVTGVDADAAKGTQMSG